MENEQKQNKNFSPCNSQVSPQKQGQWKFIKGSREISQYPEDQESAALGVTQFVSRGLKTQGATGLNLQVRRPKNPKLQVSRAEG